MEPQKRKANVSIDSIWVHGALTCVLQHFPRKCQGNRKDLQRRGGILQLIWDKIHQKTLDLVNFPASGLSLHFVGQVSVPCGLLIKAFSFHFSFSKWVNQIFISLFTSRNEWTRFPFHFSLLELPISTLAGHWFNQATLNVFQEKVTCQFLAKVCYPGWAKQLVR